MARLDPRTRRLMSASYILSKRRAELKAAEARDLLADRFERQNAKTLAAIEALRSEIAHERAIGAAMVELADENRPTIH